VAAIRRNSEKGQSRALVTTEPDAAMGIPTWINEDGSDSIDNNHPKRWSLSREYQIHGFSCAELQGL
jgi:hypothetical protein